VYVCMLASCCLIIMFTQIC